MLRANHVVRSAEFTTACMTFPRIPINVVDKTHAVVCLVAVKVRHRVEYVRFFARWSSGFTIEQCGKAFFSNKSGCGLVVKIM